MDPRKLFADERFNGLCAYCGSAPSSRDHVPSKVLLDEPYPLDLPVVEACESCNNGFSNDERYLACMLECVLAGTTDFNLVSRGKVSRTLEMRPDLATSIEASKTRDASGNLVWMPDEEKGRNVILKLARGHLAYEYSEPRLDAPESVSFVPMRLMPEERLRQFETVPDGWGWPEIGSRAFQRALVVGKDGFLDDGWQSIQLGRYRYLVYEYGVRMVLSEYLACEVAWD